ncbi:MAG: PAS domain S-box protein [Patescibacteria group bacterium]|nr:PAS domain S-box protein [Patescibacteria group bacterium]
MQPQKVIEALGYNPREAKVYLATLALGEAHISDIAEKAGMPRSTAQMIVDTLYKDGLLNFYIERRYKYWVAEHPAHLLKRLEKREAAMRSALPTLSALLQKARWGKKRSQVIEQPPAPLRELAEGSLAPVLITNSDTEILHVNAAWEKEFGYTRAEVRGKNPYELLQSGKTPPEVYQKIEHALQNNALFQTDALIDRRKDGSFLNLQTTLFSVHHEGKAYYVQILKDITAKKQAHTVRNDFLGAAS